MNQKYTIAIYRKNHSTNQVKNRSDNCQKLKKMNNFGKSGKT